MAAPLAIAPRRSGSSRALIDLGQEQPIEAGERRLDHHERRNFSSRWLIGAVLTGLCGVSLIGSALYLDLDRQSNFAEAPELAAPPRHEGAQETGVNPGKSDRLVRPVDVVADKQTYRAATTIRIGDKDVVKSRSFTHVATTLTMSATGFAADVPEFNPLNITAATADEPDQPVDPGLQDDAEVAFATRDLTNSDAILVSDDLTAAEAQSQVIESIRASATTKAALAIPPQLLLMRTSRAGLDPVGALPYAATGTVGAGAQFASIDVRMVPENVTNAPRSPTSEDTASRERMIVLRHGETLEDVLRANGAAKPDIDKIMTGFGAKKGESPIAEGQRAALFFAEAGDPTEARKIARISIYSDEQLKSTIAVNDAGDYVAVTLPPAPPAAKKSSEDEAGGLSLYESFYQTALKQNIPRPIIDEMVKAFANDVDFQRSVTAGDSVEAFYSEPDEIDPKPELLFATVTARDLGFKYYRFQTPDDGLVDYYDENGRSVRKFLIRKPIAAGEMTSPFGMRFHPILRYARMHTGVDWSNAVGTPVLAAGAGSIIKAGWTAGYGEHIEIQHANGYVTTYSHLSGFARRIAEGAHVTQGQVIGYLGATGLATGPHLHYEVIVNGRYVDPLGIKLARTREFDGKMLALFKHERDRVDQLMSQAPNATPVAQAPSLGTPVAQRTN